jgi:hypothetical protein
MVNLYTTVCRLGLEWLGFSDFGLSLHTRRLRRLYQVILNVICVFEPANYLPRFIVLLALINTHGMSQKWSTRHLTYNLQGCILSDEQVGAQELQTEKTV